MQKNEHRYTLTIACLTFLFLGLMTAGLGPVLPELAGNTSSSLTAVGGVFTAIFLGALISQIVSGPLNDRFGQKRVLFVSLLILAFGTIGFTNAPSLWLMLAITFLAGLGHGSVDLTTNVLVSRTFTEKNTSTMNLLHFFFGLGAILGPALISLFMTLFGNGLYVLWLDSAAMVILAIFVLKIKSASNSASQDVNNHSGGNVYRIPSVWLLGGLLLIYVGVENGIGGWATTYMNKTSILDLGKAALVSSGFWGALTLGRLATALIGHKFTPQQILRFSFISSLFFGLVFSFSVYHLILSIVAIVMIGFFSGAVYPTAMSLITTTFHQSPGKAASIGAAMGSVGGMTIPWIQGYLLENVNPSASAWFITGGICLMVFLLLISERVQNQQKATLESKKL
jgi:MFS transporter, FHS family, Na+ dependent glucose transporter 1